MKHERKFRDDDYYGYREERGRDRKKGRKGRKGEGEFWADGLLSEDSYQPIPEAPKAAKPEEAKPASPRPFRYNEESTVEIKGFKVDLSRVESITKEESVHNGRPSHGIRFLFMGGKGLGRTFWYGANSRQRDAEYADYSAKWAEALAKAQAKKGGR